ncbi:hypothetical protein [Litoribrevibacter albus]|uniref:DUF2232 domain-containing protein n=1 Tax=Litoribrevibacter albus TaxID=1473156 RepID=A0AA37S7K2_9GAMM|nr:hypothetical protein [Litoribrevibacter albus]GLQ30645.1 hypothetical protein GCM10007876_11230 [Litoribrevibacter albus]
MLWLAQTALKSRLHAISLAVGFVLLPFFTWLGAAVAALITLAKGPREGGMCFAVVSIPSLYLALDGQRADLIHLLLTWLIAVVLWWSKSWIYVLVALVSAGCVQHALVPVLTDSQLNELTAAVNQMIQEISAQNPDAGPIEPPSQALYAGGIQLWSVLGAFISLMFARYMQAAVYNPGGFRKEFHSLRFPYSVMSLLLGAAFLLSVLGDSFISYVPMLVLPLVIAGISVVHGSIEIKKLGGNWLVLFYVSLVLVSSLTLLLLIVLAALDSVFDIRSKLSAASNENNQY